MNRLLLLAPLVATSLVACGSVDERAVPPGSAGTSTSPSTSPTSAPARGGGGWIGGEPDWTPAHDGDADGGAAAEAAPAMDGAGRTAVTMAAAATTATVPPGGDGERQNRLRAGSVDDNADFAGYLAYLDRYRALGVPSRPFDPSGRIVVSVVGADGRPAMGVPVSVSVVGGDPVATLRTTVDGRAIFLPATYGAVQAAYHVTAAGGAGADATPGSHVILTLAVDGGASAGVPVDVLFLLDVTGSMGDEIDQLKTTIADVSTRLEALPEKPDIRFGMTLFRDEGDTFVTSTFDFTGDVGSFEAALADVRADGGGDTPEAVDEAFAAALDEPSWRDPATTAQLIFLVGDAAPHVERDVQQAYPHSIHVAQSRGITVHVVAASATDDPAEHAFRAIAQGTGGRFVFLAYGAGGAALGEHTDIASTDYEELSLDDLVVRLVSEALDTLTGVAPTPPDGTTTTPVTTTPPTNPPGQ